MKKVNEIPLSKSNPTVSIGKQIRLILLTPIAAKALESILMKSVNEAIEDEIDAIKCGCSRGNGPLTV